MDAMDRGDLLDLERGSLGYASGRKRGIGSMEMRCDDPES